MKGFIHIVEIVIISLVMFLVVTQFSSIPQLKSEWPKTRLMLQGNDLLFSLDKTGIGWLNSTEVEDSFAKALNGTTIQYDLSIKYQNGTEYNIVQSRIENPVIVSYYKPIDDGQFQMIEIILKLGYLYG